MNHFAKIILAGALLFPAAPSEADIAVIANPKSPLTALDKDTAMRIFLKKTTQVNGVAVEPFDLPKGEVRNRFYLIVADRTADNLLAYWYRLMFTGKGMPPHELSGPEEMLQRIAQEADAIGYMDAVKLNGRVKVLLLLKE